MADDGYEIRFGAAAKSTLRQLRAFDRARITEAIEKNLIRDAFRAAKNRKPVPYVRVAFEHREPLWELRVGEYRVFYDGTEKPAIVYVREIRHKPPGKTTEEITR